MTDDAISRRSVMTGAVVAVAAAVAGFVVAKSSSLAKAKPPGSGGNSYGAYGSGSYGSGGGPAPTTSWGSSSSTWSSSSGAKPAGKLLASLNSVPQGGGIVLAAQKVVLTRGANGALHAFSALCTHMGCTLGSVEGGKILCPCHGSQFNAWTGAVIQGPATSPLPSIPVSVQGNDVYET